MQSLSDRKSVYLFLWTLILGGFFLLYSLQPVQAQTTTGVVENRKAALQAQLDQIEAEIEQQRVLLVSKQQERSSLERDVSILNAKIKTAQLSIKARDISIQQLGDDIGAKQTAINGLNEKLRREKLSLAQLLRKTADMDAHPAVTIMLGGGSLSQVFDDIAAFNDVQRALHESFNEIEGTKVITKAQQEVLEDRRNEEVQLRQLQVLEEKKIEQEQAEKKRILTISKGVESLYQQLIASKEKSAAQIRAELFTLTGSVAIPFEKALQYATDAGKAVGIRPAFILGIIAEESNLGQNVGTGTWTVDMHPTRDRPVFQQITAELGLNPNQMPVSKKPWYGWGGAMGPAQFIASTWSIYDDKVASIVGTTANPWNIRHAFLASGLLLKANGALSNESKAAAMYYCGGNYGRSECRSYANSVLRYASQYEADIKAIGG